MQNKWIHKTSLTIKPNMADYNNVIKDFNYEDHTKELVWFDKNHLNAAYNAVTVNAISHRKNKVALFSITEEGEETKYTFEKLDALSNQFANYLLSLGVEKGDRVFIFLPRIAALYIAFLAILKVGAIAGTLFSAFGPQALFDRLDQSGAKVLITDENLYSRCKTIKNKLPNLKHYAIIKDDFIKMLSEFDKKLKIAKTKSDDDAFMLYTSGTTGKPKGVVHQHKAIIHQYLTAKWVLDLKEEDIYWCTADPGWVTGIAYEILGSWANGATTIIYEGRFDPQRWFSIIQDYEVSIWYTAPTAIRMLSAENKTEIKKFNFSSLRHLTSVGEPLNPEMVYWSVSIFNKPFHDTYWQTETGGIVIANYPSMAIKPGSMGKPFPGIKAHIVDDEGNPVEVGKEGNLTLEPGWPSLMKKLWKRPKKYESYFIQSDYYKKKLYVTGDMAYKDKDNYFWFVGRADDVIKTSGERVGPFEVESALVSHPDIVEAGVIGKPDPVRGEIIKAFIVLNKEVKPTEHLKQDIVTFVKKNLAGHAYPKEIEFTDKLPKTRSGKIMRRILKAKELGQSIGDTSTLEEY